MKTMKRFIIGSKGFSKIYFESGHIRFRGDDADHKIILDKLGIYADFHAARSGQLTHIVIEVPASHDFFGTINKLEKIKKDLDIKFFDMPIILEKYNQFVLHKI